MNMLTYTITSLLFAAFFSGMEIAFISSNKLHFELGKRNRNLVNRILDFFYRNPNDFISTMLVCYYASMVVCVIQMSLLLKPIICIYSINQTISIALLAFSATILILFFVEFLPKAIFKNNPNLYLHFFSIPLFLVYIILFPVSKILTMLSYVILSVAGIKQQRGAETHSFGKVDLDYFIQQRLDDSSQKADIESDVKIFQNALDFSKIRLRDCIVPRTEVVACDRTTSLDELKTKFIETGYSKILVYEDNIDEVIGYIHSSELFATLNDWTTHIITVPIVPENMTANKLMKLLLKEKRSIAVVVDEFGGTSGIVTFEDLVEEIFGEIEDEHDVQSLIAKKLGENEYLLSGRMEIDTLNEKFGLELPESDDYITIAGYILHNYQKFPKVNDIIDIGRYSMKIVKVTSTKIELVRMKVID